jgi:hypothetical protein
MDFYMDFLLEFDCQNVGFFSPQVGAVLSCEMGRFTLEK